MKIDEFDIMIVSDIEKDRLSAEISRDGLELGAVYIENGTPIIEIGPDRTNEHGVWTINYSTFRKIVKALDDFISSMNPE